MRFNGKHVARWCSLGCGNDLHADADESMEFPGVCVSCEDESFEMQEREREEMEREENA